MSPAEFAVRHRVLHEEYCSDRAGAWSNTVFPYQQHVMNAVEEAIRTGKRGVVLMKAGQIGGTDAIINAMLWLKVYFPGPQLFMTSTEKVASEFGRERFGKIIPDMAPLRRKYIPNRRGDILTKRFTDGKIQLSGGQSVFNLQSTPYRVVLLDELDSLVENLGGQGDPLKLAAVRTDSFGGPTLIIAYAHPSTRDRGAAKLFYESSDQRRGFIAHAPCGHSFTPDWAHVSPGENPMDPGGYVYACPGCGAVIEDAERVAMVRKVEYRSVLPPEVAATKAWIGLQAGQFFTPTKTLRSFAERWIECGGNTGGGGGDENAKRVFFNKVLGEPYEPMLQTVDTQSLRRLIVVQRRVDDPEFYCRGQVPAGVRFLTAGQDSRSTELHFAVWGWGLRRAVDKNLHLCGWLIDWGVIQRQYSLEFTQSEFHVFDGLIYRRKFASSCSDRYFVVLQGGHDIGYPPTQIPIIGYCRSWPNRAVPIKGASLTATSASTAPYARWGAARKYKAEDVEVVDDTSAHLQLNTFMLKTDLYGMLNPDKKLEVFDKVGTEVVGVRKVPRVTLPHDVDDQWLAQSAAEALSKGKRHNELTWVKSGPNHFADCNTYALGCAMNLDPFQMDETDQEYRERRDAGRRRPILPGWAPGAQRRERGDPSMG